jgi:hypothetical protein
MSHHANKALAWAWKANADSGDCLFGVFGADVEVGIANPTSSCSSWMQKLAGKGLAWYPINQLVKLGARFLSVRVPSRGG